MTPLADLPMIEHLLTPKVPLELGTALPPHVAYLSAWREDVVTRADDGDIAASQCLQAAFIDLVVAGEVKHDWLAIMDEHLTVDGKPMAYSARFGARLFKFDAQYKQSTVHAIHTRWWLEKLLDADNVDHECFAGMLTTKTQSDGLIYDLDVSETTFRHRMKSELTMSGAMAAEILLAAGQLGSSKSRAFATNLADPKKCPPLGYLGMEYFRLRALQLLGHEELFPAGIDGHLVAATDGLAVGWCDFAMSSKVDAYMGTAKRTGRDKPIHSPLITLHARALIEKCASEDIRAAMRTRLQSYAKHLSETPTDIPAFQMRDVPIPFGADATPIEFICASHVIASCGKI